MQAPARPSLTCVTATRIEESLFLRSATSTGSSMVMTSVASTIVTRGWSSACSFFSCVRMASGKPTSTISASSWRDRKLIAAGTVTETP
jgi:hypothetical protein